MVTIASIAGTKYLIDVGFGSNGPTAPVPLVQNHTRVKVLPENAEMLTRQHIPDNTHKGDAQLLWVYNFRFSNDSPWLPAYCFSEVEFLPADFVTMNFFVSRSPASWFTYSVVCLKFLMREGSGPGGEEMVGDLTLFGNELRKREMGKASEKVCEIESEEDRVSALQRYLGVKLSQPERDGIRGMMTSLG
jgi:arylamine N-acetyltransferase